MSNGIELTVAHTAVHTLRHLLPLPVAAADQPAPARVTTAIHTALMHIKPF
ncbi:MAG: hypothetical protein JSR77_04170 [Planctomycetes bacterium]|nr:hypothetical protein [Planctomycetota bacterium]